MKWLSGTVKFDELEARLNLLTSEGWDIFSIMPVLNTHACVVAVKREDQIKKGKK